MKSILLSAWALAATVAGCGYTYVDVPIEGIDTRFYYTPDPVLQDDTRRAARSLSAATGLSFQLSPWGVQVRAVEPGEIPGSCAQTRLTYNRNTLEVYSALILVALPQPESCMSDVASTIQHEMIHSVRRDLDLGKDDQGHVRTGVFQGVANDLDRGLNAESLAAVCEAVDCVEFNPEE